MTTENERVIDLLENVVARRPVDMGSIRAILKDAVGAPHDTQFCLAVCGQLQSLPNNDNLIESWFRHAIESAVDWRDQYCTVKFARQELKDPVAAAKAYESKPWLEALGFALEHSCAAPCTNPDSMVLASPEGICDNDTYAMVASGSQPAKGLVLSPPFIDGELQLHCFLRPGIYSGSIVNNGGNITLVGIAGSGETVIELGKGEAVFQSSYAMSLHGLTIQRVRGDGADIPAVAWRNLAVIEVCDCVISNPGGTALGSVGEIGENVDIRRCLIKDSRRGVDVQALYVAIEDTRFEGITDAAITMRIHERWPLGQCTFRGELGA